MSVVGLVVCTGTGVPSPKGLSVGVEVLSPFPLLFFFFFLPLLFVGGIVVGVRVVLGDRVASPFPLLFFFPLPSLFFSPLPPLFFPPLPPLFFPPLPFLLEFLESFEVVPLPFDAVVAGSSSRSILGLSFCFSSRIMVTLVEESDVNVLNTRTILL